MSLSSISIKRPITTLMFYIGVLMLGILVFQNIGTDFLPPVKIPKLTIQTAIPNTSPDEIENNLTRPIESALNTIAGVKKVSSITREGLSIVTLEFYWDVNMDYAFLNVREKLDQIRSMLPKDANRSTILRIDPSTEPIMTIAMSSKEKFSSHRITSIGLTIGNSNINHVDATSLMELKETAKALVKQRIEQLEGVAQVSVLGGVEREINVEIDTKRLNTIGLSFEQVTQALANANVNLPGGTIKNGMLRYTIRTLGELTSVNQIQDVIIAQTKFGRTIRIVDIGTVKDTYKERNGLTRYNGEEIISLEVRKEAGANTIATSKQIRFILNQLQEEYPSLIFEVLTDQAEFINQSVSDVIEAIIVGAILAFLVLFFFLRSLKYPFIIGLTTFISIVATFVVMYFLHITLNIISLTGLALGIGMLGDNAIIVIENVTRLREKGMGVIDAALVGAKDINLAVTASTLTNVAIFLPILFVEGVGKQLFVDMGISMTVSLIVSLLVAVTLVPMLVSRHFSFVSTHSLQNYIRKNLQFKKNNLNTIRFWMFFPFRALLFLFAQLFSRLTHYLKVLFIILSPNFYRMIDKVSDIGYRVLNEFLEWGLNHRKSVMMTTIGIFIISMMIAFFISSESAPDIDNSRFIVQVEMPKGTTLEFSSKFSRSLEKEFHEIPGIDGVYSSIGITDDLNIWSASSASIEEIRIEIKVNHDYKTNDLINIVRGKINLLQKSLTGVQFSVKKRGTTFDQILRQGKNDIKLRVFGEDPKIALKIADQLVTHLTKIDGLVDIRTNQIQGSPEYKISIDRERAGKYGLTVKTVAQFLTDQVRGREASFLTDFDRKIAIRVQPIAAKRKFVEELLSASISVGEHQVPIREFIKIEQTESDAEIWRENQNRVIVYTASINGRSLDHVLDDIHSEIDKLSLPVGYSISIGGENEEIQQSIRTLIIIIMLSLFLVYMILAAEYESVLYPLVILLTSPLAFIGAIIAMAITGQHYNLFSMIGIVIMIGAVDNDAVIVVDIITVLRRDKINLHDAIKEGMRQRLRPIMITLATTVLGVIPLVFNYGSGSELVRSLSIPLVGGLLASTFFTIVAIPIVYTYIDKWVFTGEGGIQI
jgi:hydrophobic/amphiphilic exporter-1 (mainly G- bacteria), HAE1 family